MKDVSRVVHKLKDLGVIEPRGKAIHYKCGKRMPSINTANNL
jgi:hypothetical protein